MRYCGTRIPLRVCFKALNWTPLHYARLPVLKSPHVWALTITRVNSAVTSIATPISSTTGYPAPIVTNTSKGRVKVSDGKLTKSEVRDHSGHGLSRHLTKNYPCNIQPEVTPFIAVLYWKYRGTLKQHDLDNITEKQESAWCRLCRHWRHSRLSKTISGVLRFGMVLFMKTFCFLSHRYRFVVPCTYMDQL